MPLPVHSLVWDEDEEVLYTGDESGRIRKWNLKPLFKELEESGLSEKIAKMEEDSGEVQKYGQRRARVSHATMGRRTMESSDFQNYIPLQEYGINDIEFVWGVEAHDDSTNISLVNDENGSKSILSWSSDRTVKMWTTNCRPMGMLLAGIDVGAKNPAWNFHLDAEKKTLQDEADAMEVFKHVRDDEFKESDELGGENDREAQVMQAVNQQSIGGVNVKTIRQLKESARQDSSAGGSARELEIDRRHMRALAVLSDMHTMSAQGVTGAEIDTAPIREGDFEEMEKSLAKAGR